MFSGQDAVLLSELAHDPLPVGTGAFDFLDVTLKTYPACIPGLPLECEIASIGADVSGPAVVFR